MKFIRILKASEKWAVYLRGEKISPSFDSQNDAKEWAEENFEIDNDEISIQKDYDNEEDEWEKDDLMLFSNSDGTLSFYHLGTDHKVRVKGNSFSTKEEANKWYKENYQAIDEWLNND